MKIEMELIDIRLIVQALKDGRVDAAVGLLGERRGVTGKKEEQEPCTTGQ
jgi:hypothetical protein